MFNLNMLNNNNQNIEEKLYLEMENQNESQISFDIETIIQDLISQKKLYEHIIFQLFEEAIKILDSEQNLLRLSCPITICGGTRGNFSHLLEIFKTCGDVCDTKYLFLGNYFGKQNSLDCICLLLALKVKYPERIYLLIGFHDLNLYLVQNFSKKLRKKLDNVFQSFSLAAIIEDETFCVHSGLYMELQYVEEINNISAKNDSRRMQFYLIQTLYQHYFNVVDVYYLLSSTPIETQGWNMFGRGEMDFGYDITQQFLQRNKLKNIVRGRQIILEGFKMEHDDKIFSICTSPNTNQTNNLSAVLQFDEGMNPIIRTFKE